MYNPSKYVNNLDGELKYLGIDLDGTLAEEIWPEPGIGEPILETVAWVREQHEKGYKILIHTSRASAEYKDIAMWCDDHGVPFKWIECGKPLYKLYVDNRGWCPPWLGKSPEKDL